MATPAYVDLDTIQRPSSGAVAPSAWGDQVNDNFTNLEAGLAALPARVLTGVTTVTTNSAGTATVALPATYSAAPTVIPAGMSGGGGHIVCLASSTTTTFTVAAYTMSGALAANATLGIAWIAAGT